MLDSSTLLCGGSPLGASRGKEGCCSGESRRTLKPIVTGSSVLGVTYKDGVMICCDTKASYGNMCRYVDVPRVEQLGCSTMVASSGEYSDFQFICDYLRRVETQDWIQADHDNYSLKPKEYASLLSRLLYHRRCKFNPLWNSVVLAGMQENGEKYLGYADMYGTIFQEQYIATGMGRYFALTLFREEHRPEMGELEARNLLEACMKILYYRDTGASNRIQIATVTSSGVSVGRPKTLDTKWDYESWTAPTSAMSLAGCSW